MLGLIGKELRNELTNTWLNYVIPIGAAAVTQADGKEATVSILDIVEKKEKYKPLTPGKKNEGPGVYTGILLVADPVERTPPYIEDVVPGSPANKAKLQPDDLIVYIDGVLVGEQISYLQRGAIPLSSQPERQAGNSTRPQAANHLVDVGETESEETRREEVKQYQPEA